MKKAIAYLSIFGAGCAVGVLGARLYYKKQFEDRIDEEIEAVRIAFDKKSERLKSEIADKFKDKEHSEEKDIEQEEEVKDTNKIEYPSVLKRYDTYSQPEEKVAEKPNKRDIEHPQEEDYEVYFTDVDEFLDTSNGYDKLECSYYVDDGVLVGPDGEPINVFDTVVNIDECLEEFADLVDEVCYIRNDKACEDYEITKVLGAYKLIAAEEDY